MLGAVVLLIFLGILTFIFFSKRNSLPGKENELYFILLGNFQMGTMREIYLKLQSYFEFL